MSPALRFDDYRLDPARRELTCDGAPVPLPARAFDCLAYLAAHRDRAVGRDELIAAAWGKADVASTRTGLAGDARAQARGGNVRDCRVHFRATRRAGGASPARRRAARHALTALTCRP